MVITTIEKYDTEGRLIERVIREEIANTVESDGEKNDLDSSQSIVYWEVWEGWKGNHDQRVEEAKCSSCGYKHPMVHGIWNLSQMCPNCKSIINSVGYGNGVYERIN